MLLQNYDNCSYLGHYISNIMYSLDYFSTKL